MRTNLINRKQINNIRLTGDKKVPNSINLSPQTMSRLISASLRSKEHGDQKNSFSNIGITC